MTVWIFQANPDRFKIDQYLNQFDHIAWSVRQKHLAHDMRIGDLVYLWRAAGLQKGLSGIIASARIESLPAETEEESQAAPFWKDPTGRVLDLRVQLKIERRVTGLSEILKRDRLKNDPITYSLPIIDQPQGTNFLVSPLHANRIAYLWTRLSQDWTEAETLAGLWAYSHLRGGGPEDLAVIDRVSILIGRSRDSVRYKTMNFRAIDPTRKGAGLPHIAIQDQQIWNRYYDETRAVLKTDALEKAFYVSWSHCIDVPDAPSLPTVHKGRASHSGAPRQSDPEVRRVVETWAMNVAEAYYRGQGYEVRDVSARESFDLVCTRNGTERRVEVKGTQTAGEKVFLTANEVRHAQDYRNLVDLFICRDILVIRTPTGPVATGGVSQIFSNWKPEESRLEIVQYTYEVPESMEKDRKAA